MLPLALLLGLRAAAPGEAAPAGLELRWEAPAECPDRARLLAAIDATLGEVEGERRSLRVRGRVRAESSAGFVVRLELDDGRASTRELRGTSCEELTEAAALVIAMAIDPRLLERAPLEVPEPEDGGGAAGGGGGAEDPSPRGGPSGAGGASDASQTDAGEERGASEGSQPDAGAGSGASEGAQPEAGARSLANDRAGASADVSEPRDSDGSSERRDPSKRGASDPTLDGSLARDRRPRAPERLRFLGRAQAGVGGGPLPGAAAVLGLVAGLGGRGWRAELSASYWTPRTRASSINPAVGVRAQLWTLGVHGCGEPRWRTLSFPLCAGVLAGAVHAHGVGELDPRSVASRWVAVALEPGLVWWARPRVGVALRAEGHAALARPELRSDPSGTVFSSAIVCGAIRAGVDLRVP